MNIDVVILAAGKGSRMKSQLPKVLQPLAGRPLLAHVLETANALDDVRCHIVIGHGAEQVKAAFAGKSISWITQQEQKGTGHAVMMAASELDLQGITLVLYGDVPLVKVETLQNLLGRVDDNNMALLTVELVKPSGYGRIVRDEAGKVIAIVEEKDATTAQKSINEVNTGILAIKTSQLLALLPQLSDNNAQKEYYLTDVIALSVANGVAVNCLCIQDETEVQGVNDKKQLMQLERAYQQIQANRLMDEGVTLADASRLDIRGELTTGQDVFIDINCVFSGKVTLGNNVSIGPNCVIGEKGKQVFIGNHVEIKANSIIEEAQIAEGCVIGPYARLRPGTVLAADAKIGNFVETKKANIGKGSKVNHLTYIGDADIGEAVNIGAGTITCNYDGVNKFKTIIEDGAFIGSNTSLVAPVKVGKAATVGAGSTINKDVDDEALAVARARQKNIEGWQRPVKK